MPGWSFHSFGAPVLLLTTLYGRTSTDAQIHHQLPQQAREAADCNVKGSRAFMPQHNFTQPLYPRRQKGLQQAESMQARPTMRLHHHGIPMYPRCSKRLQHAGSTQALPTMRLASSSWHSNAGNARAPAPRQQLLYPRRHKGLQQAGSTQARPPSALCRHHVIPMLAQPWRQPRDNKPTLPAPCCPCHGAICI